MKSPSVSNAGIAAISQLIVDNKTFRDITMQMSEIVRAVDEKVSQFKQLPGQLVRIDKFEALAVLTQYGQRVLRALDPRLFTSMGIERGDNFILHEIQWSPDAVVQYSIPAVSMSDSSLTADELDRLASAERPLPQPEFAEAPSRV